MFPLSYPRFSILQVSFEMGPSPKVGCLGLLQQYMFKSYSAQWIHQPSCSVPYTLLTAVLNHTDLLSSHITQLTHSEFMLTVIPKCFLNLYFYHACLSQPAFYSFYSIQIWSTIFVPKEVLFAACWKYFNSWLLQFIGIPPTLHDLYAICLHQIHW